MSESNNPNSSESGINNLINDRMTMQQAIFNQFYLIKSIDNCIEEPKAMIKEETQIKDLLLTDDFLIVKQRTEVTGELPAI